MNRTNRITSSESNMTLAGKIIVFDFLVLMAQAGPESKLKHYLWLIKF